MKIWPFDQFSEGSFGQYISPAQVEAGLLPVRQIRDAVGKEMEIGIECHFRWNRASMERIVAALEPFDILFIEDVLPATVFIVCGAVWSTGFQPRVEHLRLRRR